MMSLINSSLRNGYFGEIRERVDSQDPIRSTSKYTFGKEANVLVNTLDEKDPIIFSEELLTEKVAVTIKDDSSTKGIRESVDNIVEALNHANLERLLNCLNNLFSKSEYIYRLSREKHSELNPIFENWEKFDSNCLYKFVKERNNFKDYNLVILSEENFFKYVKYLRTEKIACTETQLYGREAILVEGVTYLRDVSVDNSKIFVINTGNFITCHLCNWVFQEFSDRIVLSFLSAGKGYIVYLLRYAIMMCVYPQDQICINIENRDNSWETQE